MTRSQNILVRRPPDPLLTARIASQRHAGEHKAISAVPHSKDGKDALERLLRKIEEVGV